MKNRFEVIGGCNAYYLLDTVTNREVCMGDGVGINFGDDTTDLECGMVGFAEAWEMEINLDVGGYFETYFLSLHGLVIFDNPNFIDRYTVILGRSHPIDRSTRKCPGLHECLGLSAYPDSPQGFSQWGQADPEFMAERNEKVHFLDLPKNVQAHIARRLEE